jgi:hypothetical protein
MRTPIPHIPGAVSGEARATRPGQGFTGDRGGWTLMLVPATICLAMIVVAFWW